MVAVEAGDKENASKVYSETVSVIDSTASKGVIHKNCANNKKSKLAKKLEAMA